MPWAGPALPTTMNEALISMAAIGRLTIEGARGETGVRVVSLKVAGHGGVTTVPQIVAAIDWVVEHRNTDGLNI
jgi:hypothetical protein